MPHIAQHEVYDIAVLMELDTFSHFASFIIQDGTWLSLIQRIRRELQPDLMLLHQILINNSLQMAGKRKGQLTSSSEWAKHLRNYFKRKFWKGERQEEKKEIDIQLSQSIK